MNNKLGLEWSQENADRLCMVLEKEGVKITPCLRKQLFIKINGLRINPYGNVCYLSFFAPSKGILLLLSRYNVAIRRNFNYITKHIGST